MRRHHHPPGDPVGDLGALLLADDVQTGVDPGGRAGGGDHRVLVDVQHVRLDPRPRVAAGRACSACRQCAAQRRPSSSPAAPSTKTPEQTLSTACPALGGLAQRLEQLGREVAGLVAVARGHGDQVGLASRSRPYGVEKVRPGNGCRARALGGDHREVVDGQPLVAPVDPEDLADDAQFEGVYAVQHDGGDIAQHGDSVPRRWQEIEGVRQSCH